MRTLHLLLLVGCAGMLFVAAPLSADEPATESVAEEVDLQKADGLWVPTSIIFNGQTLQEDVLNKVQVRMDNGNYTATIDKTIERGTYKVDVTKSPKEMDIFVDEGPSKGKTILAIYEFHGDTSKVCYGTGEGQRPMAFAAPQGSQFLLIEYKRMPQDEPGGNE